jgi:hypothetical protein
MDKTTKKFIEEKQKFYLAAYDTIKAVFPIDEDIIKKTLLEKKIPDTITFDVAFNLQNSRLYYAKNSRNHDCLYFFYNKEIENYAYVFESLWDITKSLSFCKTVFQNILSTYNKMHVTTKTKNNIKKAIFETVYEDTIINYIKNSFKISNKKYDVIGAILDRFSKLSISTYENSNFVQTLIIRKGNQVSDLPSYFEVINEKYLGPITSNMNAAIVLNEEGMLLEYKVVDDCSGLENIFIGPQQLRQFIQYSNSNKDDVVINLSSMGDIGIVFDGSLKFLKYNKKWLFLDYQYFFSLMQNRFTIADSDIRYLFGSLLDSFFSRKGSCISIHSNEKFNEMLWEKDKKKELVVLEVWNDLNASNDTITLFHRENRSKKNEIKSKAHKISIIKMMTVDDKMLIKHDRVSFLELLSLDGATILINDKSNLKVRAAGAIVKPNASATSGGREAAARTLSKYGLAFKVSADGGIELFDCQKLIYVLK